MTEPTDHVIGGWYVEIGDGWQEHRPPVQRLTLAAQAAARALSEEGILQPREVRLRNWLEERPTEFQNPGMADFFFDVDPPLLAEWLERNVTELARRAGHPEAIPEIVVNGTTNVIESGDVRHHWQACELTVGYDGAAITAMVTTYSTVWLPNDLAGRPQRELAAANGARLARTLRRLGEVFRTDVEPMGPTRYAVSTVNGLDNHRDIQGNVIAVPIR